jgi:chaperonin GroES
VAKSKAKKPMKKAAKKPAKTVGKIAVKTAAKKAASKPAPKTAKKASAKTAKKTPVQKAAAKKAVPKPAQKVSAPAKQSMKISDWENFLTPLDDRLIVQPEEGEKMTPGGLYIPDTVQATGNYKGTVLAVGRGHRDEKGHMRPMDVKAGDVILFSEHSGTTMALQGHDVKILRESEVLGIVLKN